MLYPRVHVHKHAHGLDSVLVNISHKHIGLTLSYQILKKTVKRLIMFDLIN